MTLAAVAVGLGCVAVGVLLAFIAYATGERASRRTESLPTQAHRADRTEADD